jgi:hypothetical protein
LSVDAFHCSATWPAPAVARRLPGTVGFVVSAGGGVVPWQEALPESVNGLPLSEANCQS